MLEQKFKVGEAFVFDIEGDGLKPTKIYCLSLRDVKGKKVFTTTDYDEMRAFLSRAKYLIGHNIITFDIPNLERILDIKITARLIDTLPLSWYLYPNRPNHRLEDWGVDLGIKKPEIDDWHNLSVEEYIHRCEEDVKINHKLFIKMWYYLMGLYDTVKEIGALLSYFEFKMSCSRHQEQNRWKIDRGWAEKILTEYENLREEKVVTLASAMPKVPVYVEKKRPKAFYKKDGSFSSRALQWIELCKSQKLDPIDGPDSLTVLHHYNEPNPASSQQVKDWLFDMGWVPSEYKHVKGSDGTTKEIPQVNLPFGKGICPDIKRLQEEVEPALEALEGLAVLNHRIPQIKTLLEDADEDGYTYAGIAGFSNTLRMRHARLVNMPKPDKLYSEGIRASLVCDEGYTLVGSDLSSLEDRIKQHLIFPLDPDYVKAMQRDDFDPHLTIAEMAGLLTQEQVKEYLEDGSHSKVRSIAKNGNYACQYGAGVPRLVITMGVDKEVAASVHEAYWKLNWAVKQVAEDYGENVRHIEGQTWLYNPISGLYYPLRSKKDVFSTLVQGTASFIFDYWLALIIKSGYGDALLGQFHDEFILQVKDTEKEKVKVEKLIGLAIKRVEEKLNFNVTLRCGTQFGYKYSDIH